MEAMEILRRCRDAGGEISRLEMRIQQRRDAMTSISAPPSDDKGGSRGQGDPDKMGRMLAEIDALERRIQAREQDRAVETAAACVLLDALDTLESSVLHAYYLKRESVAVIARRLSYQEGYLRKIKSRGEKALQALPEDTVRAALPAWYIKKYGG